ncbi:glycosyltransferase [Proteus columbae]|uniref:glycosyltransferase n=1 Tax=Proteus columbae TaxID=1987580 RepID=UPI0034D52207
MKIICLLGEKFYKEDNKYYYSSSSCLFINETFSSENVSFMSQVKKHENEKTIGYLENIDFIELPFFDSNISLIKYLLNPVNFVKLNKKMDSVIRNNPDAIFWVRNPALISIIFTNKLIKNNRFFISHFCADVKGISRKKYKPGIKYILSSLLEKYILNKMNQIDSYEKCIIFSTGDILNKRYKNSNHLLDISLPEKEKNTGKNKNDFFLFVGRIQKDKGIIQLIDAFNSFKINNSNYKLVIVGYGKDFDEINQLIKKNNYNDIILTGPKNTIELQYFYSHCHSLIVPSCNTYEGFPRVIAEAWYYEKPVIVTNVGGINALAINNINSLIINDSEPNTIKDALVKMTNEKFYEEIKANIKNNEVLSERHYWNELTRKAISSHYEKF